MLEEIKVIKIVVGIIKDVKSFFSKNKPVPEIIPDKKPDTDKKIEIPWNVPFRRNPNFTGREGDMMKLKKMLGHGSKVIIDQLSQIKGMGGVGKTQLAVEYAYENKDKYPGGILWVGGSLDVWVEYAKLADVLKLDLPDNMPEQDKCLKVKDCLNHRQDKTLLVLDNQDDKKAYDEIRKYLPNIGECRILVTTRLKDLEDGSGGLSLDILPDSEAKELLYKESGRGGEDETALKICRTLGNLPLAIEVAGKYLKKMTVVTFEEYYNKLIDAGLSHPSLDTDITLHNVNHTASIKATLAIHKELMENEQIKKILSALTCFEPDSINPQLLAVVCSINWENDKQEIWELITTLDNYSILEIQQDNRLNIHRLMREALCEQLPEDEIKVMQQGYVIQMEKWFDENNDVTKLKITTPEVSHILEATQIARKKNIWPQSYDLCIALGKYYDFIGRYRQGLNWAEKSEAEIKTKSSGDQEKLALSYNEIGLAWNSLGEYQKAIEFYEKSLDVNRRIHGEKHDNVSSLLNNLGMVWYKLGNHEKAVEFLKQALAINREVYGEKHPNVARNLNNLGEILNKLGKHKKAIEFYEQALVIDREVYGEKHPRVAIRLNNLGSAWNSLKKYQKAIEFHEQALVIDREFFGEKHPNIATRLNNLGSAWLAQGEVEKAREYFQQAYEITQEFFPEDHFYNQDLKEKLDSLPS